MKYLIDMVPAWAYALFMDMMTWADDDIADNKTVAWQTSEFGAWSKTHRTNDNGVTTLCGKTVPVVVADSDSTSSQGRCKKCLDALG